jgi:hypothetical protein
MPCESSIDVERKLVLATAHGVLTTPELLATQDQLLADPDFDPEFSQLNDFRGVTALRVTQGDVQKLAQKTPFACTVRRAFVVSTDVVYGYARMFAIRRELAGESHILVCRDYFEALRWLGRSESLEPS